MKKNCKLSFLVRDIGWDENKISRSSLSCKLQLLTPSHPRFAFQNINYRLQMAVVVGTGFGIGVDGYGSCP
jgi:hypothetical protein